LAAEPETMPSVLMRSGPASKTSGSRCVMVWTRANSSAAGTPPGSKRAIVPIGSPL
jgi:hypothetical protein